MFNKSTIEALPPLRDVITAHDLAPKKSLGQNFLLDLNITDKIVRAAQERYTDEWTNIHAIEIGPGPGGLTRSILKTGVKKVTAIEFDPRAVTALQSLIDASDDALNVLQQNALNCNLQSLSNAPRIIIANLPYNIASPLLLKWLQDLRENHKCYHAMTLMFQKEVAERICAAPKTRAYGRLAVIAQWLCDVEIVYHLPPSAFTPPPKVESAIVHFTPKPLENAAPTFNTVEKVTAAAFGQRRKMIRSSLKNYAPALKALDIDGTRRAETLSVHEFLDIASYKV